MKKYDISLSREFLIQRFPNANFDGRYTFYYDETNNLKKLYVKETELSSPYKSNFVLGGLVFEETDTKLDRLFSGLKLQKNLKDVKLKHLAHGAFLDCIKSQKLNYFLEYLFDNKLTVHFHWINLLYWSTADIVDSCVVNSEIAMKVGHIMAEKVKDDLYMLAKYEIDKFIDLFYRYGYPNIKRGDVTPFLEDLESLFYPYIYEEELHFGLESLRQILEDSKEKGSLPFMKDEEDNILIKEFGHFYIDPIALFKNSQHILDNEATVHEMLSRLRIVDGEQEIKNYSFVASEENRPIQASDIYVGIMGKLSAFVNSNSLEEIISSIETWSELQKRNTYLLMKIMNYSAEINPAFIHSIDSHWERDKVSLICDILDVWEE